MQVYQGLGGVMVSCLILAAVLLLASCGTPAQALSKTLLEHGAHNIVAALDSADFDNYISQLGVTEIEEAVRPWLAHADAVNVRITSPLFYAQTSVAFTADVFMHSDKNCSTIMSNTFELTLDEDGKVVDYEMLLAASPEAPAAELGCEKSHADAKLEKEATKLKATVLSILGKWLDAAKSGDEKKITEVLEHYAEDVVLNYGEEPKPVQGLQEVEKRLRNFGALVQHIAVKEHELFAAANKTKWQETVFLITKSGAKGAFSTFTSVELNTKGQIARQTVYYDDVDRAFDSLAQASNAAFAHDEL
eukprot:jgi/Chlat1/5746/Chrsp38S05573